MMHPDHLEMIYKLMCYGMALICAIFASKILGGIVRLM